VTGEVRYSEDEFKAEITKEPVPFYAQESVDQKFSVDHVKANGEVIVYYSANYMRSLPVIEHIFSIPDSEKIYFSFVEEDIFDTFYFVYKKIDSSTAGAVCGVVDEDCVEFDVPPELNDLEVPVYDSYYDDFEEDIVVYSSLNLISLVNHYTPHKNYHFQFFFFEQVGFPVFLCATYDYYIFNSEGIERKVENFGSSYQPYNADPRVMHAYSAFNDGDGSIGLRYDSLTTNEKIVREVSSAEIDGGTMTLHTSTTFNATDLAQGTTFDIVANTHIIVKGLDIHLASTETHEVSVYFRKGSTSFVNVMRHPGAWELVVAMESVQGAGAGSATPLPAFQDFSIGAGAKQGIYVTLASGKYMWLTSSNTATGDIYSPSENENVGISVGVAKNGGIFLYTTKNMVFIM